VSPVNSLLPKSNVQVSPSAGRLKRTGRIAAMRNPTFLCVAIVVTAVISMLSDLGLQQVTWHFGDIADLLMILFIVRYLRSAESDEFRWLIRGMLAFLVMMMLIVHIPG